MDWEFVLLPTPETFLAYFIVNLNISQNKKIVQQRRDSLPLGDWGLDLAQEPRFIVTNVNSVVYLVAQNAFAYVIV